MHERIGAVVGAVRIGGGGGAAQERVGPGKRAAVLQRVADADVGVPPRVIGVRGREIIPRAARVHKILVQRDGLRDGVGVGDGSAVALIPPDLHGRDLARLRHAAGVAREIQPHRAERQRHQRAADHKPLPALFQHARRFLQQHLRGQVSDERARQHGKKRRQKVRLKLPVCDERDDDHADHERAAERERVQEHRAQPAHRDHIAAALHLALFVKQQRQRTEQHAHGGKDEQIRPALQAVAGEVVPGVKLRDDHAVAQQKPRRSERRQMDAAGVRHPVDKRLQNGADHQLYHGDGEIQDEVDDGHHDGVAHDHAAQHRKVIEKQEAEHILAEHLRTRAELRRAHHRRGGERDGGDEQHRHDVDRQPREIVRCEHHLAPDGQRGVKIRAFAREQVVKREPRRCQTVERRADRGKHMPHREDLVLDVDGKRLLTPEMIREI